MKKSLKTASGPELAEILGVTHQAIYKAVKTGRLSQCVIGKARDDRRFEIYKACLEWENGRDNGQVRNRELIENPHHPQSNIYPPVAESRQAFEYYQAVNEQLTALKGAGKVIDIAQAQNEVFMAARIFRDRLMELPEKMRFTFLSFGLDDADVTALIKLLHEEHHQLLMMFSEMDLSGVREPLTDALQLVADGLPGALDADS